MTDAIARLRGLAAAQPWFGMREEEWLPYADARAILASIDALTAERDTAVAALAQRDAEIVAWLRKNARLYEGSSTADACMALAKAIERGEYRRTGD